MRRSRPSVSVYFWHRWQYLVRPVTVRRKTLTFAEMHFGKDLFTQEGIEYTESWTVTRACLVPSVHNGDLLAEDILHLRYLLL